MSGHSRATAVGAVDIGGTKIAIAAIGEGGRILARDEIPTQPAQGFSAAIKGVVNSLRRVSSEAGRRLSAIGIGCTGPVDPRNGTIGLVAFLGGWQGCNPVAELASEFGVAVAMENDADAAVLAEAEWGAGRGKCNVISVSVGTGIGGGILLNGALYRGVDASHPEIGHHVIDLSGPGCFCGARGCWEVLASGPAILRAYLTCLRGETRETEPVSAKAVCELARNGDAAAVRAVELEGRYLGVGLANLITLFAPEVIVMSGSVMESADLFMPTIRRVISESCGLVPAGAVEVVVSSLGRDASLIGAGVVGSQFHRKESNAS